MSPPLVQEAFPRTRPIGQEQFVFLLCQHGAEGVIKSRWLHDSGQFRLAFSRPGLLTLKISEILQEEPILVPEDWMIRLGGLALGQVRGPSAEELADEALELSGFDWDAVHVCQRDYQLPGIRGFEPGTTALCHEISSIFAQRFRRAGHSIPANLEAEVGQRILDIVLVEPNHWIVGHHRVALSHERWPGGAYPLAPPTEMVSRAYMKMAEAVAWSDLPLEPEDSVVEIGSAPGGSCQRLLDLGLRVTGVDPAAMHPMLLDNNRFEHWRGKAAAMRRKMYSKFRWLTADANAAPNYTLDFVEDIVTYKTSRIEGLLLTLKLSDYALAEHIPQYVQRVRDWGYERVEVRQLAFNRRECCLVAQRL